MSPITVAGVVLARLDSSRLPGKALLEVEGRPLIDIALDRVGTVDMKLVLATSDRPVDDPLADHGARRGLQVYRGPIDDVASRFVGAAGSVDAEYAVRINGDSPFADAGLITEAIAIAEADRPELITTIPGRTFPYGVSAEVVRCATLDAVAASLSAEHREHVTLYLYENLERFDARIIRSEYPELESVKMTVDTADDLDRFRRVASALGGCIDSVSWVEAAAVYRRIDELNAGAPPR